MQEKEKWDPDFAKRKQIKSILDMLIPDYSVRLGGSTSIDITKAGIDKAYGIRKLEEILNILPAEMIYIGDALFPGGNDYPAKQAGVQCIAVKGPDDTKREQMRSDLCPAFWNNDPEEESPVSSSPRLLSGVSAVGISPFLAALGGEVANSSRASAIS